MELGLSVANTLVSFGALAGVIVWASQPDLYRGLDNDGYGLYWFIAIASSIWGVLSVFGHSLPAERWIIPAIADSDKVLTWAGVFFIAVWVAAESKVANYLTHCIYDDNEEYKCTGEIITTAFGGAAVLVWALTLAHYFFKDRSVKFSLAAWELTIVVFNALASFGALAGVIVWASQPDLYRGIDSTGYGLYWFAAVASSLWGVLAFFAHVLPANLWIIPTVAESDKVLTWVSVFFVAVWVAATAYVANYLTFCVSESDAGDSIPDQESSEAPTITYECVGEIITTTFGGASVFIWLLSLLNYFFKAFSVKA